MLAIKDFLLSSRATFCPRSLKNASQYLLDAPKNNFTPTRWMLGGELKIYVKIYDSKYTAETFSLKDK